MAIDIKSKFTSILILASVFFVAVLLLVTYSLNSRRSLKDQTNNTFDRPSVNDITPVDSNTTESAANQAELTPAQSDSSSKANSDTVKPGQSSTSNSQTTINISNTTNQSNTTVSLVISKDGCTIDANGPTGTRLVIDTKNDAKGGHQEYTLSGTPLSIGSGGKLPGMSIEAKLVDPSGAIKASSTSTIGSNGC